MNFYFITSKLKTSLSCPPMQRAAFFWGRQRFFLELSIIDIPIDNNCLIDILYFFLFL